MKISNFLGNNHIDKLKIGTYPDLLFKVLLIFSKIN